MHEKSLLLALLPLTLLADEQPALVVWLNLVGTLSMFPLLRKDGLSLAYIAAGALFWAVMQLATGGGAPSSPRAPPQMAPLALASGALAATLHAAAAVFPPPARYPFLHDAAFMTYAFVHLAALFAFLHREQYLEYKAAGPAVARARKAKAV